MIPNLDELLRSYVRAAKEIRLVLAFVFLLVSASVLIVTALLPKSYTATASIYADNSNILQPLMAGNAVSTGIRNQALMAQDILFSREFDDLLLEAGEWDTSLLTVTQKDQLAQSIRSRTAIRNEGRGPASMIEISYSDEDPIRAFRITQRYSSLFIEQSVESKLVESRSAFQFIENQVESYQTKLQDSEARLSEFRSSRNLGTLQNANNRIREFESDLEQIDLQLIQVDSEIQTANKQLEGEDQVYRDFSETNLIKNRIAEFQRRLDVLRGRYLDSYPDIVQIKTQIEDLEAQLGSESGAVLLTPDSTDAGTVTLHQQLRSRLADLETTRESTLRRREQVVLLLAAEEVQRRLINESEAERSELTRDYNVTQNFYNTLLQRLETARVSMYIDEEQQGVTFKIQEAATIPMQPDGFSSIQVTLIGIFLALSVPVGFVVAKVELDNRVRSEITWSENWPPLLITIPPMQTKVNILKSNQVLICVTLLFASAIYGVYWYLHINGFF